MSHKITTNEGLEFDCVGGDTVLRAALRAGINFPYECNAGGCGRCKFEVLTGEVTNLWDDAPGLSPRDVTKGRLLACQCVPTTDCDIKVRVKASMTEEILPVKHNAVLYQIETLTEDMAEFRFRTKGAADFKPGQFVLFDFPGIEGSRGYSMSNLPNEQGEWHFIVKKISGGNASRFLFDQAVVGDEVALDGPYGFAYLKPNIMRDIVCVAGGSGLSPEMSILRAASKEKDTEDRKIYLFYGGRAPKDICPPRLIEADSDLNGRVINYNAVSDVDAANADNWSGDVGFVHELLAKKLKDRLSEHEFYICGPPPMTDALVRILAVEYNVPFKQIHYDKFY